MSQNTQSQFPFSPQIERWMKLFYDSLNEKDKRHYVALEAQRLGYGGISYLSELLGCARTTIQSGFDELKKKTF